MPGGPGNGFRQRRGLSGGAAGAEKTAGHGGQPFADRHELLHRLAFGEDDFRMTLPDGAMMVEAGELQIFEGQVTQPHPQGGGESLGADQGRGRQRRAGPPHPHDGGQHH